MEPVKLPQHKHCQVCGRAIKSKLTMCSDECKADWDRTVKKKQYTLYAYFGFALIIVVFIMLSMGGGG